MKPSAPLVALLAACAQAPQPAPQPIVVPISAPTGTAEITPAAVAVLSDSADDTTRHAARKDSARARDTTVVSTRDVTSQAVAVFGDSMTRREAVDTSDDGPTWDIDVRSYETQERVAHFVNLFSGSAKDRFEERLQRGTRYEPMIRAKLRAAGLPEDMVYLALIESNFDPNAYSSAAAVGLWQLMTSTARGAGLRVDWWVDERRDPVRSTDAAIKFLRWLNEQFGSLYLAAAAYNGGPGRIQRGLSRYADDLEGTTGDDLFFALAEKDYLRRETRDYVPQLIAAAIVAKEPRKYGLDITPEPPYVYDTVRVGPSTPLAAVAEAAGVPVAVITELNPFVLRGVTPPRDSFVVRVPVGKGADFATVYASLPAEDRTAYTRVVSRKGQTLVGLAHKGHITSKELRWYNPRLEVSRKTGRVFAGQTVLIPSRAVVVAAEDVPDPSIERYPTSRRIHIVKSGETLGGIARHYHTTVRAIMRLNGMRKSMIFPGQAIVVHGGTRSTHHRSSSRSRRSTHGSR